MAESFAKLLPDFQSTGFDLLLEAKLNRMKLNFHDFWHYEELYTKER